MQIPENILLKAKRDCKGVAFIIWVYLIVSLASSLLFKYLDTQSPLSDRTINIASCIVAILAMTSAIFLAVKKYGFKIKKKYFIKNFSISIIPLMVVVIFGLNFINNLIMLVISYLFNVSTAQPEFIFGDDRIANAALVVSAVVIAPIFEELLFRGAILRILDRYNHTIAIISSSILFAMLHGSLAQWTYTFALGLILAYLSLKYDSLLLPMSIHFVNNMISVLMTIYYNDFMALLLIVLMLSGVAALIYLIWRNKHLFKIQRDWNYPFFQYIFLNPFMIGILIINIIKILMEMFKYYI
ncbi:MAG: CPBP family intramembrane metalloprotease [Holdemanella sp.]|nr:CPBP family intramembrane metalloprotease [Holdemanella sp.]